MNLIDTKLYLASKSPRRAEILKLAGIPFELVEQNAEEIYPAEMPKHKVAEYLAELKAKDAVGRVPAGEIVLASDTTVVLDDKVYEKPVDRTDAIRMLTELSGHVHEVITGVCLMTNTKHETFSESTRVYFDSFGQKEIKWYVDNYQVLDKAGAYAIQEGIGLIGILKIEGCYFNVMGLPVNRLYCELASFVSK